MLAGFSPPQRFKLCVFIETSVYMEKYGKLSSKNRFSIYFFNVSLHLNICKSMIAITNYIVYFIQKYNCTGALNNSGRYVSCPPYLHRYSPGTCIDTHRAYDVYTMPWRCIDVNEMYKRHAPAGCILQLPFSLSGQQNADLWPQLSTYAPKTIFTPKI